jgi:hypothetical protein
MNNNEHKHKNKQTVIIIITLSPNKIYIYKTPLVNVCIAIYNKSNNQKPTER